MKKTMLAVAVVAAASNAYAVDAFGPLTAPATLDNTNQATNPFLLPKGWTQSLVIDRWTLEAKTGGSGTDLSGSFPDSFNNFDMIDIGGANNEYIYIPMEVGRGAGAIRYNRDSGEFSTLMLGNNSGTFSSDPSTWSATNDDFGAFDPAVLTPNNTLLLGEEWSGNGRLFEVSNPETATGPASAKVNWLSNIPSVSHEGVKIDSAGRMYFVDESNTGSIYRMTPNTPGDLSSGKVEVLVDNDGVHDATKNYSDASNQAAGARTGDAAWVEIVDANGNVVADVTNAGADPFDFTSRGGRGAADAVDGTPYGRPEDLEIGMVNGEEILYWATTSENIVYGASIGDGSATSVFEAVNSLVTPDTIGNDPVGAGASDADYGLDDPDNLAVSYSADGKLQLWVIEDDNPSDIWMASDTDNDGIADHVQLAVSLGPFGSEATGWIQDPRDTTGNTFLVAIQHPSNGNDAIWEISASPVPLPAAAWFFGAALLGMAGFSRRKTA